MRKVLTFLTATLVLTWVAPVLAQQAPEEFKDVEPGHWAYQAMENLRAKGILIGYPDGYFRGRRTLTRYEFAVALDRALKQVEAQTGPVGPPGPAGEVGPAGPQGEPGTPADMSEIDALKKLVNEFKDELASLGNNVNAINQKLDALAKEVEELKSTIDKMPKISGQAYFGIRADRAHGYYVDRNDALQPGPIPIFRDPTVVHDFQLGINAKIAGGATIAAKINESSYLPTIGGNAAQSGAFVKNASSVIYVDQMEIKAPFGAVGREGSLSIGRFYLEGSKYMLRKPDVDVYLDDPMVNDGKYRGDGLKLEAKLGSVGIEAFGVQTKSVTDSSGNRINTPLAGAVELGYPVYDAVSAGGRLSGVAGGSGLYSMPVDQMVGLSAKVPIRMMSGGYLRLAAIGTSQNLDQAVLPAYAPDFTTTLILGADALIKPTDRIGVKADWAKSIAGSSDFRSYEYANGTSRNSAVEGKVMYHGGKLRVAAGYKYIDPLFYTPGYWDRLGPFINPVNIEGPTAMIGYAFNENLGVHVGGEWLQGARHTDLAQLQPEDDWNKLTAGVHYKITKSVGVYANWEGDYLRIDQGEGYAVHPTLQYIMLGTGYNITEGTLLKFGYEIGDVNDKGIGLFGPDAPGHFNYNVFTTQVAVKF